MTTLENFGKQTVLAGPWGGQDGFYWDDGVYSTIRQLEIAHGIGIDSIRIEYDMDGKSIWSQKHGGSGGTKLDKVRLEYPNEFLTSVDGHYGSIQEWGPVFVRSLTFHSNKRTYGPFGVEEGTYFTFPKMQGKIVGFLGKYGWYLDAIGFYVEPLPNAVSHSQQYVAHGTEKYEYSVMQGSLGPNYDVFVAVRQKDDHHKRSPPLNLSPQISHEWSHTEPKNEAIANVVPHKPERAPSKNFKGVVSSGPWGGDGGSMFDDGVYDGVRQINLSRNVAVVSIRVCYEQNGRSVWGSKNGSTGAYKFDKIAFDYPSEILTHLTGYYGPMMKMGPNVIKSLTFHTTRRSYGPYGDEHGEFFSTKLKEGSAIVGFHGRKGLFLDAIGVHVLEGKLVPPPALSSHNKDAIVSSVSNYKKLVPVSPPISNQQAQPTTKKVVGNSEWPFKKGKQVQTHNERTVTDPARCWPGPWGGEGGKPWDDGVFTGIKQIILTITDAICCIEIEYDRNGQSVWSVKHGGTNGQTANRVKLDYPHEVLTCVSGYYGPIKREQGTNVIQSLTFHSSRRKYGPFGEELGTYFESGTTEGKVVGFHGRSSMYLDAIGVHMQHWLGNQRWPKSQSVMKMFS